MLPNRLRISARAARTLGNLKTATGLTPNILCRMSFVLSAREGPAGGIKSVKLDGSEFNLSTLFGEHAIAYEYLIRRLHGELEPKRVVEIIACHIEDGLDGLRSLEAIQALMQIDPRRPG